MRRVLAQRNCTGYRKFSIGKRECGAAESRPKKQTSLVSIQNRTPKPWNDPSRLIFSPGSRQESILSPCGGRPRGRRHITRGSTRPIGAEGPRARPAKSARTGSRGRFCDNSRIYGETPNVTSVFTLRAHEAQSQNTRRIPRHTYTETLLSHALHKAMYSYTWESCHRQLSGARGDAAMLHFHAFGCR